MVNFCVGYVPWPTSELWPKHAKRRPQKCHPITKPVALVVIAVARHCIHHHLHRAVITILTMAHRHLIAKGTAPVQIITPIHLICLTKDHHPRPLQTRTPDTQLMIHPRSTTIAIRIAIRIRNKGLKLTPLVDFKRLPCQLQRCLLLWTVASSIQTALAICLQ